MPTNKTPVRPPARERVYDVLDGELDYQDEIVPDWNLPPSEFLTMLAAQVRQAKAMHVDGFPEATVTTANALRRIAAVAMRGMEVHGVIPCEFHVPASAGITGTLNISNLPDKF